MDDNTPQGAARSGRYFLQLYTYAFATGDTSQLEAMSDDECVFCNSVIDNAKRLHAQGGWADHWEYEIKAVRYADPAEGHIYSLVELDLGDPGTLQYKADGSSRQTERAEPLTLKLSVYRVDGQWVVHEGYHSK
ncbi:DUF6318 family protein [Actinomyces bovis]|nr:DUF6318 family protein [Actinomyces bovis]